VATGWEFRGLSAALDDWEASEDPEPAVTRLVLEWIAGLMDAPADDATTVHVDDLTATRIGCAPGTRVLMQFTLDEERHRFIVHKLMSVPPED
jgi:hypothetical protein